MRIKQEIKIKFLSAAMVVLLIFSGIFGGLDIGRMRHKPLILKMTQ